MMKASMVGYDEYEPSDNITGETDMLGGARYPGHFAEGPERYRP